VIVEGINRKRIIVYGYGPKQQIISWDELSSHIDLLDPDKDEWMVIAEF